jgi:proteasome lid subunit RPN8/RPN11
VKYRMRAEDQLRAFMAVEEAGLDLIAIWHSHPRGPAHLSPTDLAEAYYPEATLLVWSLAEGQTQEWRLLGFQIVDGQAAAVNVRVIG